jgi:hypothetical protein
VLKKIASFAEELGRITANLENFVHLLDRAHGVFALCEQFTEIYALDELVHWRL